MTREFNHVSIRKATKNLRQHNHSLSHPDQALENQASNRQINWSYSLNVAKPPGLENDCITQKILELVSKIN